MKLLETRNIPILFFVAFCTKLLILPDSLTLAALVPLVAAVIFTEYTKHRDAKLLEKSQLDVVQQIKEDIDKKIEAIDNKVSGVQLSQGMRKLR